MQNNTHHVLIVEDNADLAEVLSLALRKEGYQVTVASTIAEAYEHLSNERVDLMLLDWQLPDGTGGELAVTMRALRPAVPIIVMSGWISEREKAIEQCHPVLFLEKPIEMAVLRHSVQSLLVKTPV